MHYRRERTEPTGRWGPVARWRARRAAENAALAEADARIPSQLDRWSLDRMETRDIEERDD